MRIAENVLLLLKAPFAAPFHSIIPLFPVSVHKVLYCDFQLPFQRFFGRSPRLTRLSRSLLSSIFEHLERVKNRCCFDFPEWFSWRTGGKCCWCDDRLWLPNKRNMVPNKAKIEKGLLIYFGEIRARKSCLFPFVDPLYWGHGMHLLWPWQPDRFSNDLEIIQHGWSQCHHSVATNWALTRLAERCLADNGVYYKPLA